jgi:hypothetical protein
MTLVRRRVSPEVRSMKTPRRTGATKMTAPGYLARRSDRAPAADGLPIAVDPSTASFRALALQVRAMGLLDRRPGYYGLKITLTIFAFLAGWVLFVIVGNSWTTLAVAALAGIIFTQLGFISHDAGHNQVFGTRRRNRLLGLTVGNVLIGPMPWALEQCDAGGPRASATVGDVSWLQGCCRGFPRDGRGSC